MFGWFQRKSKRPSWAEASIYGGLDDDALRAIADFVEVRELAADAFLVREGEPASELYALQSGRLEVLKRDPQTGREHRIAGIEPGRMVGEIGVLGGFPRTASVRALEHSRLVALEFQELRKRAESDKRADAPLRRPYQQIVSNVARLMSTRLRDNAQAALVREVRAAAMGQFLVNVLILLCVYVVLLSALPNVSRHLPNSTSFVSIPLQIVFAIGSWAFIKSTGYPLHLFGLSYRHALGSLIEATIFTIPFLGLITAVKWLVITIGSDSGAVPLFEHPEPLVHLQAPGVAALFGVYALSSIVQELIVRCALQSSLQMFLTGPRARQRAILLSALVFSVTHLHMSPLFAMLAFVPGVFWGYLYARRPNLLGVSLSHTAVGGFVFFVLGTNI